MAYGGRAGGRGYPSGLGGRGVGRHSGPALWNGGASRPSSFSERTNPLWADQMDHNFQPDSSREDAFSHLDPLSENARVHWERCAESRALLSKIASITTENWQEMEHVECAWDYADAAYEAKKLKEHAMICYFTNRAPLLQDFKDWIEYELGVLRGWPTKQTTMGTQPAPFEHAADPEDGEDELDQVAEDSPNVDPPDLDTINSTIESDDVARALDGDKSEYEEHFIQSIAKGEKAWKQANRTPEVEGIVVDKLGKKQRKQLQFSQPASPLTGATGDIREKATSLRGDSRKEAPSKKQSDPAAERAEGPSPSTRAGNPNDIRKGKEAAYSPTPGK
ncbi:unnamed protein product [Calypogeia fissa]